MQSSLNHVNSEVLQPSESRARHFLAVTPCLWGTDFRFGKLAMREMTVSESVCFRFLTAAILLAPIVVRTWRPHESKRTKELALHLVASGIGAPVQFLIQFQGLHPTTVPMHPELSEFFPSW
jgi:drug/metabolite transporter (DMT)-like permease